MWNLIIILLIAWLAGCDSSRVDQDMTLQALDLTAKENAVLSRKLDQMTAENQLLSRKNNQLQAQLDALRNEHGDLKATVGKKKTANRMQVR
jgi:cell division protein FtsB